MSNNFQWPPLESDPEIFNEYAHNLGLNQNFSYQELFCLDYKEMQVIEGPVLAVIVSFERDTPMELNSDNFRPANSLPFYMKQTEALDNACGLIAMLHSLGNNLNTLNLSENSILRKFFDETSSLSDEERAKYLEAFNDFKTAHEQFASQGQSELCADQSAVKNHYVAFVFNQGNLVELDGLVKGPYLVKENIQENEVLDATISELKQRLENKNITENLSVMFLTQN